MFNSPTDSKLVKLFANSEYNLCEDPKTSFAALQLSDESQTMITVDMIINEIVRKMKDWLLNKHLKFIDHIIVQIPMIFTSLQRNDLLECLKTTGLSHIKLYDANTINILRIVNKVEGENVLVVYMDQTRTEVSTFSVNNKEVTELIKNVDYNLGFQQFQTKSAKVLANKIYHQDKSNDNDIPQDEIQNVMKECISVLQDIFEDGTTILRVSYTSKKTVRIRINLDELNERCDHIFDQFKNLIQKTVPPGITIHSNIMKGELFRHPI